MQSISVSGYTDGPFIGEILVTNSDGSAKRKLTHNRIGTEDGSPTWSPDGRTIAFTRSRYGPPAIYTMGIDGGDLRRIIGNASSPAWSPDGTRIAFLGGSGTSSHISIVDSDGTSRRDLSGTGRDDSDPVWSPDGRSIMFVRAGYGSGGDGTALWSVASDGGTPHELLRGVRGFEWSPDDKTLAYVRELRWDRFELGLMSPDGTNLRRIATFDGRVYSYSGPSWAPDAHMLAVATNDGIFVVTVKNGMRERLTRESDHSVTWSSDGHELAFVRYPNIATINAEGGPVRLLTHRPENWGPAWSP